MKNKTRTMVQINLLPPAIFISLFLAAFKLLGFVDISWLMVLSPLIFVFGVFVLFIGLALFLLVLGIILKVFGK